MDCINAKELKSKEGRLLLYVIKAKLQSLISKRRHGLKGDHCMVCVPRNALCSAL